MWVPIMGNMSGPIRDPPGTHTGFQNLLDSTPILSLRRISHPWPQHTDPADRGEGEGVLETSREIYGSCINTTTVILLITPLLPVDTSEKYENLTELLMSTSEILKFGARSAPKKNEPFLQFSRRKRSKNGRKQGTFGDPKFMKND